MPDKTELTAPCGLDCFNCELYRDNIGEKMLSAIVSKLGVPAKDVPCPGCRAAAGKHFHIPKGCATLDCADRKGVALCSDCGDFPCALLAPLADQAAKFPHNMKLYNLCRIKKIGLERWIEEEAKDIRKRYFTMSFVVGKGQED